MMDDDFINMNIPVKNAKASFDDIDTSMTSGFFFFLINFKPFLLN